MIPERFIRTAEAEYFCNVSEFISLGEGKKVSPRKVCAIKMKHRGVQDWFEQLSYPRLGSVSYVLRIVSTSYSLSSFLTIKCPRAISWK